MNSMASSVMSFLQVPVGGVSPAGGNLALVHPQPPPVGDNHLVRMTSQVPEDRLGVTEGGLGIGHPVHWLELSEKSIERARAPPSSERAAEAAFISAIGAVLGA